MVGRGHLRAWVVAHNTKIFLLPLMALIIFSESRAEEQQMQTANAAGSWLASWLQLQQLLEGTRNGVLGRCGLAAGCHVEDDVT